MFFVMSNSMKRLLSLALFAGSAFAEQNSGCPVSVTKLSDKSYKANVVANIVRGSSAGDYPDRQYSKYWLVNYTNGSPNTVTAIRLGLVFVNAMQEPRTELNSSGEPVKVRPGAKFSMWGRNDTPDILSSAWVEKVVFANGETWADNGSHSCAYRNGR
jgi:hypothetical protein